MQKFFLALMLMCVGFFVVTLALAFRHYDNIRGAAYYQKKVADLAATDHLTPELPKKTPVQKAPVQLNARQLWKYCSDPLVKKSDPECGNANLCRKVRIAVRDRFVGGMTTDEAQQMKICAAFGY
jgi:hypothetical protein